MKRPRDPHASITPEEAARAIYIDFEGFQDAAPTMVGVLVGDVLEHVVFDGALRAAAEAKSCSISTLSETAERLRRRCVEERRVLVAFSTHELKVLAEYAGVDAGPLYRDARKIARRWRSKFHPERRGEGRGLKDFLRLINYPRGTYLGERKSTKRLKAIQEMLGRRSSYTALTPVKKGQWTKLLQHNEIDCRGMQALIVRAASDLADASRK
jgi:hypothetical protein